MSDSTLKRDLHYEVTNGIISAIEAGASGSDWIMPWTRSGSGMPTNATTKAQYRGVNVLQLWCAAAARGYPSDLWASFKQWQGVGASVRKGEKGTIVVYYNTAIKTDRDTGDETRIPILKYSHVFNAAQVDGYEIPAIVKPALAESIAHADAYVRHTGADIRGGDSRACYVPSQDHIRMPDPDRFIATATATATESYYSTLLHELTHWTGHESRCNRNLTGRFKEHSYAVEELIAELGAAFACAQLGIAPGKHQDHASYIASWLACLRADKRAIFTAAARASDAVAFLDSKQPAAVDAPEAEPIPESLAA